MSTVSLSTLTMVSYSCKSSDVFLFSVCLELLPVSRCTHNAKPLTGNISFMPASLGKG